MISFIIFTFFLAIDGLCFNHGFYHYEFHDLKVADTLGVSEDELFNATDILLDYTRAKRDDMIAYADFDGVYQEFYNEREKAHMVDVQSLYLNTKMVAYTSMAIFVISILLLIKDKDIFFDLTAAYRHCLYVLGFILAVLIFFILVDFNAFWLNFHYLLFDNDLWLLDPLTSNLIKMVPEQFFNHLVLLISITYIFILGLTAFILRYFRKRDFND